MKRDPLEDCNGFDWDEGNLDKNWEAHTVAFWECEDEHMSSTRKKIPKFSSEAEERAFWAHADSSDYIDWSKASERTLPKLRPTLRTISIRLPEGMIAELKRLANKRDVPYQSLLKVFLAERIRDELTRSPASKRS